MYDEPDKVRSWRKRVSLLTRRFRSQQLTTKGGALFLLASTLVIFVYRSIATSRRVFILTHELTVTGAPRVCTELAALLSITGSRVTLSVESVQAEKSDELDLSAAQLVERRLSRLLPYVGFQVSINASISSAASADIVIVSTVAPLQLEWMRRFRQAAPTHTALVWWVHEGQSVMHQWPDEFTSAVIGAMTSGLVDALIFPSVSTEIWWRNIIAFRTAGRQVTLPDIIRAFPWGLLSWRINSLEEKSVVVRKSQLRNTLHIPDNAFVFLVIASYNPLKGHRGILKAFKRAQSACGGWPGGLHLVTVGVALGRYSSFFPQEDVAWVRNDPSLHLLGETDAVPDYLAAANAYVSNTLDGGETWGLANLEALAAGLPVLASRVGGAAEMLTDGDTALLHDIPAVADDSEEVALASHMCRIVNDTVLREGLATRGRAHARERFGQAYLEARLAEVFTDLEKNAFLRFLPKLMSPRG